MVLFYLLKRLRNKLHSINVNRKLKVLHSWGTGRTFKLPEEICIELTRRCNLRCSMCYQQHNQIRAEDELSLEEIKNIFDKLKLRTINLVGGEIFIRKDILDILNYFAERGIVIQNLTTNATLINEEKALHLARLIKARVIRNISLSFDGKEETHDIIRRAKDAFKRAFNGAERLLTSLNALGINTDKCVHINSVISKTNVKSFDECLDVAKELSIKNVVFNHLIYNTAEDLNKSAEMTGNPELGLFDTCSEEQSIQLEEFSLLLSTWQKALKKAGKLEINMHSRPVSKLEHIKDYYRHDYNPRGVCTYPFFICRINSDGTVPFCLLMQHKMGNIRNKSLISIWNNTEFKRMRKKLLSGIYPVCKRCCKLVTY
ncbi:radical SAM protein [bacterium]|nr:radical SAM protein [bacterium]